MEYYCLPNILKKATFKNDARISGCQYSCVYKEKTKVKTWQGLDKYDELQLKIYQVN